MVPAEPASASTVDVAPTSNEFAVGATEPGITEAEWEQAIGELIASDTPRTESKTLAGTTYTFHIPVPSDVVASGVWDFGVFVPTEQSGAPKLGVGSDSRGAFLILNKFDQDLLTSGAIAVLTAAACALPAIGWVSCGVITVALAVAAVGIAQLPRPCRDQVKVYLFQQHNRVACY